MVGGKKEMVSLSMRCRRFWKLVVLRCFVLISFLGAPKLSVLK